LYSDLEPSKYLTWIEWNKAYCFEATFDVCRGESLGLSLEEEFKEEWFIDVVDANGHLSSNQVTVNPLEDREVTNIERLVKV